MGAEPPEPPRRPAEHPALSGRSGYATSRFDVHQYVSEQAMYAYRWARR